jgi:hypothetical protein
MPDVLRYEPTERRLYVGTGYIDGASSQVWEYEVSGKRPRRLSFIAWG